MYGQAEATYYKQSHEEKWKNAVEDDTGKPLRVYVRGGIKMEDKAKTEAAIAKIQPFLLQVGDSEVEEYVEAWA